MNWQGLVLDMAQCKRFRFCCVLALVAILGIPGVALAQTPADVYEVYKKDVPDVDKPVPEPTPEVPADMTCWLASAANVLGAAGWGDANTVYNTLTGRFGTVAPGWSSVAINWWLYNHGLNPDAAGSYNYSGSDYTDVTVWNRPLIAPEYDALLKELRRCQYVNASFETNEMYGHEMTLVGGNYTTSADKPQVSVWHDSNGDIGKIPGFPDDDEHGNSFVGAGPVWYLDYHDTPDVPEDDWRSTGATILCPGLKKPQAAIENYDIAYFKDMDAAGNLVNTFRVAGTSKDDYTGPGGAGFIDQWEDLALIIPNEQVPDMQKELWLLVDFVDRNHALGDPILNVCIQDDAGNVHNPDKVELTADGGQARLYWKLDPQPDWERIIFPDLSYQSLYDISTGLGGPVKDWNLATQCVPEPGTLVLAAIGLIALAGYARWRRIKAT